MRVDLTTLWTPPEPLSRRAGAATLVAFTALLVVGALLATRHRSTAVVVPGAVVAEFAGVVLFLGPRRAQVSAAVVSLVAFAATAWGDASNVGMFGMLVVLAWVALDLPYAVGGVLSVGLVVTFLVESIVTRPDSGWYAWMGGTVATVASCLFRRREHELLIALRAAQAGLATRAQAEERTRIARELHDVIAHSLTVSLMHVSSARLALAEEPDDAERALAEAERLGRASLDEVRHAVGTLRTADGADPTRPLPGSTDVAELITGFRRAGADVHASLDGDLAALPVTVGLAVYRIVQEALTNAAKHAPGRTATVHIAVRAAAVAVDVDSAGAPAPGYERSGGLGRLGMRERAASVGGHCDSGPGGSGWRVHAELPLAPGVPR